MRHLALLMAVMAAGLVSGSAAASAQEKSLSLELIGNKDKDGRCTVIFRAVNKLGVDIGDARFEVYLINVAGQAVDAYNLRLAAVPSGKQRVMQFPLPSPCDQIASLVSNGFSLCQTDKDETELCNKGLRMSSRIGIKFGDDAS